MAEPNQEAQASEGQAAAEAMEVGEFESLLQKQFKPKTDRAQEAIHAAVRTLAEQALAETAVISEDAVKTIESMIAAIDAKTWWPASASPLMAYRAVPKSGVFRRSGFPASSPSGTQRTPIHPCDSRWMCRRNVCRSSKWAASSGESPSVNGGSAGWGSASTNSSSQAPSWLVSISLIGTSLMVISKLSVTLSRFGRPAPFEF